MAGIINLFDWDSQIENAVAARLSNPGGLTVATPSTVKKFQKDRPRVEVLFKTGQAHQSYHIVAGRRRNASWSGELLLCALTASDGLGSQAHREYRAYIRYLMSTMFDDLNGSDDEGNRYLPYHSIQGPAIESATDTTYFPTSDYEISRVSYRIDFGIIQAAWAELDNP